MDIKLYYQEEGNGEPLILLHGNGEDSFYFKNQIDYFQSRYHVIALDTTTPALMTQMPLKKKVAKPALRRRVFCCSMLFLSLLRKYPFSI